MRVFVAHGHQVTATTTGPGKLGLLEPLDAEAVPIGGLDAMSDGEAMAAAPRATQEGATR